MEVALGPAEEAAVSSRRAVADRVPDAGAAADNAAAVARLPADGCLLERLVTGAGVEERSAPTEEEEAWGR